jgi:hypothetical protein
MFLAASQRRTSVPARRESRSACPIACSITAGPNRRANKVNWHSANPREIKGRSLLAKRPVCAVRRHGTCWETAGGRFVEQSERERSVSDAQSLLMLLLLQREDYVIFAKSVHPKYVAGRMHYTCY